MRAPLPHDDPFNWRATDLAWVSFALIDPKMVLKFTTSVYPIYASAVVVDPII